VRANESPSRMHPATQPGPPEAASTAGSAAAAEAVAADASSSTTRGRRVVAFERAPSRAKAVASSPRMKSCEKQSHAHHAAQHQVPWPPLRREGVPLPPRRPCTPLPAIGPRRFGRDPIFAPCGERASAERDSNAQSSRRQIRLLAILNPGAVLRRVRWSTILCVRVRRVSCCWHSRCPFITCVLCRIMGRMQCARVPRASGAGESKKLYRTERRILIENVNEYKTPYPLPMVVQDGLST
jgi:hypothetical protein